ncbi:MAG: type II toxin-antitoxin system PemK/MazF family toxin [Acidobacteria bacterium]|nr:type II toxin-antitoxin system PemK/MazF family toxin [Acidobacteriota bacterium]
MRTVRQGEIYWAEFDEPIGSEPGYLRPCVVVQNDLFNQSKLRTTVICTLTTNLKRATAPGNVLLNAGEANLSELSVVNITQLFTIDKQDLVDKIGQLSPERMAQIIAGIKLLVEPATV